MTARTIALLVFSSLFNLAILVGAFLVGGFATSPDMTDTTMRIGYYVLNGIVAAAALATLGPWWLVRRGQPKGAVALALLPLALACLSVVAFLTLDSWLRRTF